MTSALPNVPDKLKIIRPYVNAGKELKTQDPVAAYYCNIFALERAMKSDVTKDTESKLFLVKLMDYAEAHKKALQSHPNYADDMTGEGIGYTVVYNAALELFNTADKQDRAAEFNKQLVRTFYTSAILFDVLQTFGEELPEEVVAWRKYARWKATYIHRCLKNHETPVAGPIGEEENEEAGGINIPDQYALPGSHDAPGPSSSNTYGHPDPATSTATQPPKPVPRSQPAFVPYVAEQTAEDSGESAISPQVMQEAEKLCKHAASALQFDDVPGAISLLEKSLKLLRTGKS
uniref:Vta1/callose synthase N-terminal domain-containing protein n=1 Tax=Ciona savignyi TaxID=51511 RepID=H2YS39_CIOSA